MIQFLYNINPSLNKILQLLAQGKFRIFTLLLLLGVASGFISFTQVPAKPQPLLLRNEPLPFTPQEFYIADVVEARKDRKAVAYIQMPGTTPAQPTTLQPFNLQGGDIPAVKKFVHQGLKRNVQMRPVLVRVKTLQVNETLVGKERVEGKISVMLDFDIQRNGKTLHTLAYKGGGRYLRPLRDASITEPTLRRSLIDALIYLNTWMNQEADRNEKLATGVKISFKDYTTNNDPDTVFYSSKRPLNWSDFRAQPQPGIYAAAVLPGFAFTGQKEVVNGIIQVNLTVKVYMVRDGSWVRAGAKNAYSLNHEQRHFDIVKIVAERFKQQLTQNKLSVEEYNNTISAQYFETLREITRWQKQYDDESGHGINEAEQERWNHRIDSELKKYTY
jgi:hypothetical protein